MAAKFSLNPNPTFKLTVNIPRPGEEDGQVTLTVRHKTRSELADMESTLKDETEKAAEAKGDTQPPAMDYLEKIIESWNIDADYNRENLAVLLENYPRAFDSIVSAYTKELYAIREKN